MNENIQSPFGEMPLGRLIEERDIFSLPSGREVTLIRRTLSLEDPPGIWSTQRDSRVDPPLDDGCNPHDLHQIQECMLCLAIVCRRHSFDCPTCGLVACTACAGQIVVPDQAIVGGQIVATERTLRVCKKCQEAAETPKWLQLLKSIFKV
jgi:hypothetical protein